MKDKAALRMDAAAEHCRQTQELLLGNTKTGRHGVLVWEHNMS